MLKMTPDNDPYFSKTIEKGLAILSLFDRDHQQRSLTEISELTGINKTSVYRFVNTLLHLGYLKKNSSNKQLKLGPIAFLSGHNFINGFELFQRIRPLIDKTFMEHSVSIDSALLHSQTLISLYRRELPNLIYFRLPLVMDDLYARAMGKAVLAHLDENSLSRFLETVQRKKLTPKTIVNLQELRQEISLTRNRGYSINNEEYVKGLICIGAPLMNFNTRSIAGAVSLDFPSAEFSLSMIERNYTGILTKLASELSEIITNTDM